MGISDEFAFIKKIMPSQTYQPNVITGIGDDAALFAGNSQVEEMVCMDTMVEGIHFTKKTMTPFQIGFKALAANVSDLAAMGGMPTFYLVSISIPESWQEDELLDIYQGMANLAARFNMDLIGGDTTAAKTDLVLSVTVLGRVEKGRHLLRSKAKGGDVVFVTGTLGDAAAGLQLLLEHSYSYPYSHHEKQLVQRHQYPCPKVELGRLLTQYQRVALNDISDGLASEAMELAEASGVTIVIDSRLLPRSEAIKKYPLEQQMNWVLNGGEDYELIGTVPSADWADLHKTCKQNNIDITKIGVVQAGAPQVLLKNSGETTILKKQGYNHFN